MLPHRAKRDKYKVKWTSLADSWRQKKTKSAHTRSLQIGPREANKDSKKQNRQTVGQPRAILGTAIRASMQDLGGHVFRLRCPASIAFMHVGMHQCCYLLRTSCILLQAGDTWSSLSWGRSQSLRRYRRTLADKDELAEHSDQRAATKEASYPRRKQNTPWTQNNIIAGRNGPTWSVEVRQACPADFHYF